MAKTSRYKRVDHKLGWEEAVSDAFSTIEELADECQEVVDNAPPGLDQTQRIQTLGETADTLSSNLDQPEAPDFFNEKLGEVTFVTMERKARSGPSRSSRRDYATSCLDAVIGVVNDLIDADGDDALTDEQKTEAEEYRDALEEVKDEWDGVEFPGMYG